MDAPVTQEPGAAPECRMAGQYDVGIRNGGNWLAAAQCLVSRTRTSVSPIPAAHLLMVLNVHWGGGERIRRRTTVQSSSSASTTSLRPSAHNAPLRPRRGDRCFSSGCIRSSPGTPGQGGGIAELTHRTSVTRVVLCYSAQRRSRGFASGGLVALASPVIFAHILHGQIGA